jgi:hypothetical protein
MSPLIPGGYAYLEDCVTGVVASILVIVKTSTKLKINQTLSMLNGCLTTTISGKDRMSVSIDLIITSLICKLLLDTDQNPHTSLSLVSSLSEARSVQQRNCDKARQGKAGQARQAGQGRQRLVSPFFFIKIQSTCNIIFRIHLFCKNLCVGSYFTENFK